MWVLLNSLPCSLSVVLRYVAQQLAPATCSMSDHMFKLLLASELGCMQASSGHVFDNVNLFCVKQWQWQQYHTLNCACVPLALADHNSMCKTQHTYLQARTSCSRRRATLFCSVMSAVWSGDSTVLVLLLCCCDSRTGCTVSVHCLVLCKSCSGLIVGHDQGVT